MKIEFEIEEEKIKPGAGLGFLGDTITLSVESGFPGGSPGEFEEHMIEALQDWYSGLEVRIVSLRQWKS